ncbi:MAG TPA: ECF-type sigma factor [Rhodothermales bacterium]|nr:ECF-type sigma factor [Rhodothermales bacterium]
MPSSEPPAQDVTRILQDITAGDESGMDRLMPLVYDELRAIASEKLKYERADHTFKTTDLVNEAFIRLANQKQVTWASRAHFYAVAAQAMRRILINYAEQRRAQKRGGGVAPVRIDARLEEVLSFDEKDEVLLALDESLERMESFNERGCRVVEYRFFGGLTHEEIAEVMGLSVITVRRVWTSARSWLAAELAEPQ